MANKLLLLKDVDGLGRKGDVVSARPGYVRNFLLPQGFACTASANALRMQARLQEERLKQAAVDKQESDAIATRCTGLVLTQVVKIDQEGHMYGSVSAHDIIQLMKNEAGIELEKKAVQLQHPIKETGVSEIKIKLKEGVVFTVTLKVVPEEAPVPPAAKKA